MRKWAVVIHGGAGLRRNDPNQSEIQRGLKEIVDDAVSALRARRSALDAVERAVYLLEDSAVFNAGLGSCLSFDGSVELDAGICDGRTVAAGAVTGITDYPHPIKVARFIMENTNMTLMRGEGAIKLMRLFRTIESENLITEAKLERLKREFDKLASGKGSDFVSRHFRKDLELVRRIAKVNPKSMTGTVGAVAVDSHGDTAAAASTGGYWLKIPGRIGDSPILGAGFYADSKHGAAAATGVGEYTIRLGLTRVIVERMRKTVSAQRAVADAFKHLEGLFGSKSMGVIAVDRHGGIGVKFNTEGMGHAFATKNHPAATVRLFQEDASD